MAEDSDDSRQSANPAMLDVGDVVSTAIEHALALAVDLQQRALSERRWPDLARRAREATQLAAELEARRARREGATAAEILSTADQASKRA